MNLLINVDVPDLAAAIAFYTDAFGLIAESKTISVWLDCRRA
jgi:catechol 2,3-dioxygenase-like lactoylglutathione lyase family enzyme